jgi:transposase
MLGDALEDVAQVSFGVESAEICRTNEGVEHFGSLAADVGAQEQIDGMTVLALARHDCRAISAGGTTMKEIAAFIGLDVHKDSISVAIADAGRDGEVRFWGAVPNTPEAIEGLTKRLGGRSRRLEYVYEAGPCGYGVYRQLTSLGLSCRVISPSHTPKKAANRIKNDTRDAVMLARLLRAGELTFIWVPDETHEAIRDLVRARQKSSHDVRQARQRIQSFLLRRDRRYEKKCWGFRHRIWLANQSFPHPAQQIAFQNYLNAQEQAEARRLELDQQIHELLPHWSLTPVVHALQALKGIAETIAVAIAAEVGDFRRFSNPRQLMAYLGLVPGEHSSGGSIRPRGITKAGNTGLRALLFEASWSYRVPAKVGSYSYSRMPKGIPRKFHDLSWKAQVRLCGRYRRLVARGKNCFCPKRPRAARALRRYYPSPDAR